MRYCKTNSINRASGSGHLSKLTEGLIDVEMKKNDETTATTLRTFFLQHGLEISIRTILRGRKQLGWSYCGSAYCQLIREPNKVKRKDWALKYLHDDFQNVVWTDETTVQLECHKRFCCRKNGIRPQYKPRPKHPIKMHVWAGISWEGPTPVCIFEEIMNAKLYIEILDVHRNTGRFFTTILDVPILVVIVLCRITIPNIPQILPKRFLWSTMLTGGRRLQKSQMLIQLKIFGMN